MEENMLKKEDKIFKREFKKGRGNFKKIPKDVPKKCCDALFVFSTKTE